MCETIRAWGWRSLLLLLSIYPFFFYFFLRLVAMVVRDFAFFSFFAYFFTPSTAVRALLVPGPTRKIRFGRCHEKENMFVISDHRHSQRTPAYRCSPSSLVPLQWSSNGRQDSSYPSPTLNSPSFKWVLPSTVLKKHSIAFGVGFPSLSLAREGGMVSSFFREV